MQRTTLAVVTSLGVALPASAALAQRQASEPASVSQTVDGTRITIEYSRPRARGRTGLFGSRMHSGETWTPGANQATTITLSKDVTVEGTVVPKGKYSVWILLAAPPRAWEMMLDPDTMLFHTQGPRARPQQVRFLLRREKRPFAEVLTWSFPEVTATGATLAMHWDTVYVPLRITVTPTYSTKVAPEAARRIVGRYHVRNQPMVPPSESAAAAEERPAPEQTLTIRYESGELRAVMDPPLFTTESGYTHWMLLPSKGDWYYMGRIDGGELVEVMDIAAMQFSIAGDRATGFELRAKNDALLATGTRLP